LWKLWNRCLAVLMSLKTNGLMSTTLPVKQNGFLSELSKLIDMAYQACAQQTWCCLVIEIMRNSIVLFNILSLFVLTC
jgi:hypothetical protein